MLNISTALDNAYAPYTYTMLYSLFSSNPEECFRVFLLSHDLTSESVRTFEELGEKYRSEVTCLKVDPSLFEVFKDRGWALPAAFRLQLPELLETCNRIDNSRLLYLDGDMIIHGPVSELYHADLRGHMLMACHDQTVSENTIPYYAPFRDERINRILMKGNYFNSGAMLIDLEKWGSWRLADYLELLCELNGKVHAPDQDLLNAAHEGNWIAADEIRYNLLAGVAKDYGVTLSEVREQNVILHYAGDKPWRGGHVHYELEQLWWEYALKTPFREKFLLDFLHSSLTDSTVEDELRRLYDENTLLKRRLEEFKEALGKILPA